MIVLPGILIGSNDPIPLDQSHVLQRANRPDVLEYYRNGGVDILPILEARTDSIRRLTPDFDRRTIVDYNTDLFPRDEYDLRPSPR